MARERRFELRKLLISRCVKFRPLIFYEAIFIHQLKKQCIPAAPCKNGFAQLLQHIHGSRIIVFK